MDVIYELFGYLNLFPEVPGFMYPVFYKDGSFYLADGDILYIKSFHPLKAELQILLERYAYSEISGTFILI